MASTCRHGSFRHGRGRPALAWSLVHGWESARDRTLPMAHFLHAAGFHCLLFDVRGHGANEAELLPISGGEFGHDTLAAIDVLLGRPEVSVAAVSGHSMGAIGAILAAAADRRIAALVATSGPADPYRLTRETFRLANLPLPDPIAYPLAWLTTRVFLRPRGHRVEEVNAIRAIAAFPGPVLLAHGEEDAVVPLRHFERLRAAALSTRAGNPDAAPVVDIVIGGGQHSWLYEFEAYRRTVARFLAASLGGPYSPDEAAERAAAVPAERLPDVGEQFSASRRAAACGRLARVALPGATRPDPAIVAPPSPTEPMTVWDAVTHKRAIRRFVDRPIDTEHLERILDAGRRAGSSKNSQRWSFIAIEDRATLRELADAGPYAGHLAGAAAAIALVTPDPKTVDAPLSVMWDLGQAAQNMMLVAWELGIGSVPATVYTHDLVQRVLALPDDQHCEFLLSFGYPARPGPHATSEGRRPAAARAAGPSRALVGARRQAGRCPQAIASGTCATRSRSRPPASRAAPRHTPRASRTARRRPSPAAARRPGTSAE